MVLLLILLSGTLARVLSQVAAGVYPLETMAPLFGHMTVLNLSQILPLTFFLAVMLALGRLYHDSEMTAFASCGVGQGRVMRTVLWVALAVSAASGVLSLYSAPLAEEKIHQLMDVAKSKSDIEGIEAGTFNTMGGGNYLVYVEELDKESGRLRSVYVNGDDNGQRFIMTAASAYQTTDKQSGSRYLVLLDGYRYVGQVGQADYRITQFKSHGILLQPQPFSPGKRSHNAMPTLDLWGSDKPSKQAELHWRIAAPISTVLLALLAVPLARTSPRKGRFGRLVVGIVAYIVYNNLINFGRSWIASEEVPVELGIWWVHGGVLLLIATLHWRENTMPAPRRMFAS